MTPGGRSKSFHFTEHATNRLEAGCSRLCNCPPHLLPQPDPPPPAYFLQLAPVNGNQRPRHMTPQNAFTDVSKPDKRLTLGGGHSDTCPHLLWPSRFPSSLLGTTPIKQFRKPLSSRMISIHEISLHNSSNPQPRLNIVYSYQVKSAEYPLIILLSLTPGWQLTTIDSTNKEITVLPTDSTN